MGRKRIWRAWGAFGWMLLAGVLCLAGVEVRGEQAVAEQFLLEAEQAYRDGDKEKAFALADKAVAESPGYPRAYYVRGRLHQVERNHTKAIDNFDEVVRLDPRADQVFQIRGTEHFRAGQVEKAVADFDEYVRRLPGQEPYHWQRGIAYFYTEEFEKGRRQFEKHREVNPNDVENAVWHFLCLAKLEGMDAARGELIPVTGDRRVPMEEVHRFYAGEGTAEEVLQAAKKVEEEEGRKQALFYAHLYLGLYYEVAGEEEKGREHMGKAANEYQVGHYMGEVAVVHEKLRK